MYMKIKISPIWILLAIFAITSLACNIQFTNTPTPANVPLTIVTQAPNVATQPVIISTQPPAATQPPVQAASLYMPSGILVDSGDKYGITLYNSAGLSITELKASNQYGFSVGDVHMAGSVSGQILTPLVFITWNGDTRAVMANINDAISVVTQSNDLYQLAGAAGQNVIAFTEVNWPSNGSGLINNVYFGTLESLTGSNIPTISMLDTEGMAYQPLAVYAVNGVPKGFYYSRAAYGIGGDIVFAPRRGLYYYEAASNNTVQILSPDRGPAGISPDMTWVASTTYSDFTDLRLHQISSGTTVSLPIESTSDRGAGELVFSPDNHYVAWMEGSGFQMAEVPDFKSLVKVATTDGTVLFTLTSASFNGVIGTATGRANPVGFIDNENFLAQVRTENWDQSYIVKVNIPSNSISLFCSGVFLGFYYP
jgi:hypothetical protein